MRKTSSLTYQSSSVVFYKVHVKHLETMRNMVQPVNRTKLDPCIKDKFVGYGEPYEVKAYRIYFSDSGKITFIRPV